MSGVQCQVDPGELRNVLIGGEERTLYFVVFVLSCSRLMYVGVAFQPWLPRASALAIESFSPGYRELQPWLPRASALAIESFSPGYRELQPWLPRASALAIESFSLGYRELHSAARRGLPLLWRSHRSMRLRPDQDGREQYRWLTCQRDCLPKQAVW